MFTWPVTSTGECSEFNGHLVVATFPPMAAFRFSMPRPMHQFYNPLQLSDSRLASRLRLACAVVVSPVIPMAWVALQTSGNLWSLFAYMWGYLVFALTGAPLVAYAYARRRFFACVVCGSIASILPFLLLASLSMFSTVHATARTAIDLVSLVAAGGAGGVIFWLISFWVPDRRNKGDLSP